MRISAEDLLGDGLRRDADEEGEGDRVPGEDTIPEAHAALGLAHTDGSALYTADAPTSRFHRDAAPPLEHSVGGP